MPHNCPHCAKELTGFTTEENLKARLAEQKANHTAVSDAWKTRAETAEAEAARLKPLAEQAESTARTLAFTRAGIPEAAQKSVLALHALHKDEAGDKALDLNAWLASDEAKTHPLLGPVLGKATATGGGDKAADAGKGTGGGDKAAGASKLPDGNAGAKAAPTNPGKPLSKEDAGKALSAFALDPKIRALKPEERRAKVDAKRAELMGQVEAGQAGSAGA